MEFNIAFNTVFYISIFIIPGILLRRSFYYGEFHKEFSQGNLLERLMWTIFSSILALLASAIFFLIIRNFLGNLLPAISYGTLKEVFDLLGTNELPQGNRFEEIYYDFILLICGVYALSGLIGFLAHKLVIRVGISSSVSLFKYKNYWYYFFRGRVKNAPNDPGKKYWYTEADILVEQDGKSKMYSGKITDYYVDALQNRLETIFLEDIKRYKFLEDKSDYTLVEIPGHVFCVPYEKVLNMNLTYVMRKKGIPIWKRIFWALVQVVYFLSVITAFSFFWIEEVPYLIFSTIWHKAGFFINLFIVLSIIRSLVKKSLYPTQRKEGEDFPIDHLIGIAFFLAQFLWIVGIKNPLLVIGISLVVLLFIVSLFDSESEDESNEGETPEGPESKKDSELPNL